jgi:hypothetical protein
VNAIRCIRPPYQKVKKNTFPPILNGGSFRRLDIFSRVKHQTPLSRLLSNYLVCRTIPAIRIGKIRADAYLQSRKRKLSRTCCFIRRIIE